MTGLNVPLCESICAVSEVIIISDITVLPTVSFGTAADVDEQERVPNDAAVFHSIK